MDDLRGAVRIVVIELPAQQVHQPVDLFPSGDDAAQVTRTVYPENGLVPVGIDDMPELRRYVVERIIPGDTFELPLASFTDPLQGVE